MKLVATMPVRNEEWVLALSARVALLWADAIVIYVHASTDRSWEIACELFEEYGTRVLAIHDDEPIWDEMHHRQAMLTAARQMGATHIAIVDADEILTGNLLEINMFGQGALMDRHCGIPRGSILQLPGYNLRGGIDRYHSSGIWGNRWFSVAFADDPRLGWSGDKFHAREPAGFTLNAYRPVAQGAGGVMHLWGASERRLRAKHRAYRIQEALRWPNKPRAEIERMYSLATDGVPPHDIPRNWAFANVPESWWKPYRHWIEKYLDIESTPWQEAWCDEMIKKHGIERFAGLTV